MRLRPLYNEIKDVPMPIKTYLITENDLQSLIRETDLESFYRASSQYKRHDEDREK